MYNTITVFCVLVSTIEFVVQVKFKFVSDRWLTLTVLVALESGVQKKGTKFSNNSLRQKCIGPGSSQVSGLSSRKSCCVATHVDLIRTDLLRLSQG